MATVIRLSRKGRTHVPFFHIVACEARSRRDGAPIETIGWFDPRRRDQQYRIDLERVRYWLSVGAMPTDTVAGLLKREGLNAEMWSRSKKRALAHRASARRESAKKKERRRAAAAASDAMASSASTAPAAATPSAAETRKKRKPRTTNSKDRKAKKKKAGAPAAS